jgi:hypothetical protein
LGEKREGDISIRSSGGIPVIDETYVFLVESDSKTNSRFVISQTSGLPVVGVTPSSFGLTVCKTKGAVRREDNPLLWDVTCTFSSEVEEGQGNQETEEDPTEWIPIYETKFERRQVVVVRDFAGTAVANSAGQPFENGLTVSRFLPVWEFFQFEPATVSDETVIGRNEVVNTSTFRGRAAKTLLCNVVSSQIGVYYGLPLRFARYRLVYDYMTWRHKRLDVGTVYKSGSDLLPYTDKEGNVILGGLNGSGAKVTVGTAPSILQFDMYSDVDFNSFLRF